MKATPPITPPTMAPTWLDDPDERGAKPTWLGPFLGIVRMLPRGVSVSGERISGAMRSTHRYTVLMNRAPKRYVDTEVSVQPSMPLTHVPSGCGMTSKLSPNVNVCDPTMRPKLNDESQGICQACDKGPSDDRSVRSDEFGIASSGKRCAEKA